MKIFFVKAKTEHFKKIQLQDEQMSEAIFCNNVTDDMFSFVDVNNNVYAIFRFVEMWKDRVLVSAFIGRNSGKVMLQIVRILNMLYKANTPVRLEAEVLVGFSKGEKFLKIFGFHKEAVLEKYYNNKDYSLWVKIKE